MSALSTEDLSRVRETSPAASAGQGLPAPTTMSEEGMQDQARALVGKLVVYTCRQRSDDSSPFRTYAGTLATGTDRFIVKLSAAYNYLAGVEQHKGVDVAVPMPHPDWLYTRLVDASVHQTEKATEKVSEMSTQITK